MLRNVASHPVARTEACKPPAWSPPPEYGKDLPAGASGNATVPIGTQPAQTAESNAVASAARTDRASSYSKHVATAPEHAAVPDARRRGVGVTSKDGATKPVGTKPAQSAEAVLGSPNGASGAVRPDRSHSYATHMAGAPVHAAVSNVATLNPSVNRLGRSGSMLAPQEADFVISYSLRSGIAKQVSAPCCVHGQVAIHHPLPPCLCTVLMAA